MNNSYANIKPIQPKSFLDSVMGSGSGYVVISHTPDPKTKFLKSECLSATNMDLIVHRTKELSKKSQVYFGINRRARRLAPGERGGNDDVGNISIIGMDIDVSSPEKPDKNLPRTQEEALTLLEGFSLKPSYTISSGSGVHAYWAFADEIVIETPEERKNAQELVQAFYRGFAEYATPFKFDATHDLSRMLRFPGSWNHKDPLNPKSVHFLTENPERLYSIAEIKATGVEKAVTGPRESLDNKQGLMDIEKVRKGCGWVNNAIANPKSVKYSDWFALASVLYFAPNGRSLFHEWSKEHPEYDAAKTDALFDQVNPDKAKRTCESISTSLHGESYCGYCPFKGGIQSPVDLGLPGKRYIIGNSGSLPSKTAQAWASIYVANDPKRIFCNRTGILRVNPGEVSWDVMDSRSARHEFSRTGDWMRSTKNGLEPSNPEQIVIDDLLETINPPLPHLKKVTTIPVITAAGKLVSDFGYDEESQIYRVRSIDLPRIDLGINSKFMTPQDAIKFIFEECLSDFPFATQQDRAHALALMLHDFVRNLFSGPSPFFLVDKPIHGTGATLLVGILCFPSLGRIVPNKTLSLLDEEVRKQITSHLMSGGGPYLYDNLPDDRVIDSNVLASLVTSTEFSDRILGTNIDVKLENRGPWIGTGNNPDFAGQMKRRILRIRLIPTTADPYLRDDFLHDPLSEWVAKNREDLVDACLTIVMSWINAGRPEWGGQPLGSFESFSKVMGGILKHAGFEGFMTNMDFQRDTGDSEAELVRELIQEWWIQKENANLKVTEIVQLATAADLDIQDKWFDLKEKTQVSKAGKIIRKVVDRHFSVDVPEGRKVVQLILGGVKHTYRLKEKQGD
jgi:hypothetical protein